MESQKALIVGHENSMCSILSSAILQKVHKGESFIPILFNLSLVKNFLYRVRNWIYLRKLSSMYLLCHMKDLDTFQVSKTIPAFSLRLSHISSWMFPLELGSFSL